MAYPYGNPPDAGGSQPSALESRHGVDWEPRYSDSDQYDPNFGTRINTTTASSLNPEQLAVPDDLLLGSWVIAPSEQDYYANVGALEDHTDNPPRAPLPFPQTDQSIHDFVQQYQAEHARDGFGQADPWFPGHRLGTNDQLHPQYTVSSIAPYSNQHVATDGTPHPSTSLLETDEPHHAPPSNAAETLDGSTTDLDPRASDQSPRKTKTCAICGAHFTGRYGRGNFSRHFRQQHSGQRADSKAGCTCRTCKKVFKRQDARRKHEWRQHQLLDAKPCPRREMHTERPEASTAGIDIDLTESEVSFDTRTMPSDSDFVLLGTQAGVSFQTPTLQQNPYDILMAMGEASIEQYPQVTDRPTKQLVTKDELPPGPANGEGLADLDHDTDQDTAHRSNGHAFLEKAPGDVDVVEMRRRSQQFNIADQPASLFTPARSIQSMAHRPHSDSCTPSSNGGYTGSYFALGVGSEYPAYLESPNTSLSSAFNHNESANQFLLPGEVVESSGPFSGRFENPEDALTHNTLKLTPQALQYYTSSMLDLSSEHEESFYYEAS